MPLSRRHFVRSLAAGTGLLAAGTGAVVLRQALAAAAHPDPYAPWRGPDDALDDPRLRALAFALLAPNPHNLQPWKVRLLGDDALELWHDPERWLPATDPHARQLVIGHGAFLEVLALAAQAQGWRAEIVPFPEGADPSRIQHTPIARVRFVADAAARPDPLFEQVLRRHTHRGEYAAELTHADQRLAEVRAAAGGEVQVASVHGGERLAALKALAIRAWEMELRTTRTWQESVNLLRVGNDAIARQPWGLAVPGIGMGLLRSAGVLDAGSLADPQSAAFAQGLEQGRGALAATPALIWLSTADNRRESQLAAGRATARMMLRATAQGLAIHPASQALQEYPEMAAEYAAARRLTNTNGSAGLQMLLRYGRPLKLGPPAPREALERRLLASEQAAEAAAARTATQLRQTGL